MQWLTKLDLPYMHTLPPVCKTTIHSLLKNRRSKYFMTPITLAASISNAVSSAPPSRASASSGGGRAGSSARTSTDPALSEQSVGAVCGREPTASADSGDGAAVGGARLGVVARRGSHSERRWAARGKAGCWERAWKASAQDSVLPERGAAEAPPPPAEVGGGSEGGVAGGLLVFGGGSRRQQPAPREQGEGLAAGLAAA